jgi:hypothetical protein
MEIERQAIVIVTRNGRPEVFPGSFRQFILERGIPHAGPLIDAGQVYCSVILGQSPMADVHWRKVSRNQIAALAGTLMDLGLSPNQACAVTVGGERMPCTVSKLCGIPDLLTARRRDARRPLSRQFMAAEEFGVEILQHDLRHTTLSRVVWGKKDSIQTNEPSMVGLDTRNGPVSGIMALHVGDPEFWHAKLEEDYGRTGEAFELEIIPTAGDVLVEDVQYTIPEDDGSKADSAILLTTRRVLRQGKDFRVVRELCVDRQPQYY